MKYVFYVFAMIFFLTGCVTFIQTKVESYSAFAESPENALVYVTPLTEQDIQSLQWAKNKSILNQELISAGFNITNDRREAKYIAYFGYSVDEGELVTTVYSVPEYGVTGYSGAYTQGTISGNNYSGVTKLNPNYGITGYSYGSKTNLIYTRSAGLFLVDKRNGNIVFEGLASSSGSCHSFTPVAPYIIKSILSNFPEDKVGNVILEANDLKC